MYHFYVGMSIHFLNNQSMYKINASWYSIEELAFCIALSEPLYNGIMTLGHTMHKFNCNIV